MGYVSMLASRMQRYPIQEVLREPYLTNEFDTQIIDAVLQKLNPNNLILMVTDPDAKLAKRSIYYQAPYAVRLSKRH